MGMCALWPWPWRYGLVTRSWHTLGSWTTNVWKIIQIQQGELWSGHWFWVCAHCDLDLGDITLGQGHDTPLGHEPLLCKISRFNMAMRSYGPDMDFGYMCTVTLTIWPWVMDNNCVKYYPGPMWQRGVMAPDTDFGYVCTDLDLGRYDLGSKSWHTLGSWTTVVGDMTLDQSHDTPLGHGQQLFEISRSVKREVKARTQCELTDGRTDGDSYIPSKLCCGGYKLHILGNFTWNYSIVG